MIRTPINVRIGSHVEKRVIFVVFAVPTDIIFTGDNMTDERFDDLFWNHIETLFTLILNYKIKYYASVFTFISWVDDQIWTGSTSCGVCVWIPYVANIACSLIDSAMRTTWTTKSVAVPYIITKHVPKKFTNSVGTNHQTVAKNRNYGAF